MKRKRIYLLSALAVSLAASAQGEICNSANNRPYFGIRASYDLTCPTKVSNDNVRLDLFGPGSGFSVGAVYNVPLVANLYFEPGVNIYYDTFKLKALAVDYLTELKGSIRQFGFRVPLHIGYHFDFTPDISVSLFTGPTFDVACTGKFHLTAEQGILSETTSENIYGDNAFSRFDCSWDIGTSLTYAHHYYFGVTGNIGMADVYRNDLTLHKNRVQFTLGYNF